VAEFATQTGGRQSQQPDVFNAALPAHSRGGSPSKTNPLRVRRARPSAVVVRLSSRSSRVPSLHATSRFHAPSKAFPRSHAFVIDFQFFSRSVRGRSTERAARELC